MLLLSCYSCHVTNVMQWSQRFHIFLFDSRSSECTAKLLNSPGLKWNFLLFWQCVEKLVNPLIMHFSYCLIGHCHLSFLVMLSDILKNFSWMTKNKMLILQLSEHWKKLRAKKNLHYVAIWFNHKKALVLVEISFTTIVLFHWEQIGIFPFFFFQLGISLRTCCVVCVIHCVCACECWICMHVCANMRVNSYLCTITCRRLGIWFHLWTTLIPIPRADAGWKHNTGDQTN